MSSPLKQNTTTIQELLNTINSLPEAENLDTELDTQATLLSEQDAKIAELAQVLAGKAGGNAAPLLQEKTVTPTTSIQYVTPDSDYDGLSKVTVNSIPNTYVKPNATKAATTYTPSTSNQTIAAGTYCSGVQTIKGDSNLKAENIVSGVSIFGVTGNAQTGGGDSGGSSTISVTITSEMSLNGGYYFDENGMVQVIAIGTKTVNALNGIVFTRTPTETIAASGNYVLSKATGVNAVRFLEDGGSATVSM